MRYRRVHQPGGSFFFTLVTYERLPLLADASAVELFRAAVQKVQTRHPFALEAEVVLPDHVHMLWTLPEGDSDYAMRVRLIKRGFTQFLPKSSRPAARSSSRALKGEQSVWQRRYWEHTIRDEADFLAHLDYIHFNPVKHRLARAARDWPHSTFAIWVDRGVYGSLWGSDELPPLPQWVGRE